MQTFRENPFFKNKVLSKEFTEDQERYKIKASNIEWKSSPEKDSFFYFWFNPQGQGEDDEIADAIKEDVWPRPAFFYLGLKDEDEGEEEDEDEDEEDDE